jgi:threonine dehydratase
MIRLLDIVAAQRRIGHRLRPTPLRHSFWLSAVTDATVYLKLESLQLTNSFKIRGALNAALRVVESAGGDPTKAPQIVTASAGNHGRALAVACEQLGLRTVVFTPRTAPYTKKAAIRRHGADLRDDAVDYDAAERAAAEYATSEGAVFISPYNHPDVIAGAGTTALEVLDVLPSHDMIVAPLGGGGLASGIGVAIKAAASRTVLVGVEAAASMPFAASRPLGRIVAIEPIASLADGLTGNLEPESSTFDLVERVVDRLAAVEEAEIAAAIRGLAAEEHLMVEGAGAVTTAAALAGRVVQPGQTVVLMVTGANIDIERFADVVAGVRAAPPPL